jgi:hypothetical protein
MMAMERSCDCFENHDLDKYISKDGTLGAHLGREKRETLLHLVHKQILEIDAISAVRLVTTCAQCTRPIDMMLQDWSTQETMIFM